MCSSCVCFAETSICYQIKIAKKTSEVFDKPIFIYVNQPKIFDNSQVIEGYRYTTNDTGEIATLSVAAQSAFTIIEYYEHIKDKTNIHVNSKGIYYKKCKTKSERAKAHRTTGKSLTHYRKQ